MSEEPKCPECATVVRPTWDWCMACGYDPEHLKPSEWKPGTPTRVARVPAPSAVVAGMSIGAGGTATLVADARPQVMAEPDWVAAEPREKLSYLTVAGLLAAILIAIGGLIFVTLMVLHQPIGTAQADAMPAPVVALIV